MTTEPNHIVAYRGNCGTSLGLLQKSYGTLYTPGANLRTPVRGTLQRPPYWPEDFDDFVEMLRKNKGKDEVFAMLLHEGTAEAPSYRYIGHMGIHNIKWPDGAGVTGSMIVDEGLQGKGSGTEAKLLILYHAFFVLGLRNVKSNVKGWNAKSLGHLVKCGYRIVGRYTDYVFHEGSFVDEVMLQVNRKDFEPIWAKYQETKQLPKLNDEQRALVKKETNT